MQLASTFSLSSLSSTLIFCVTDFVMQGNTTSQLTCFKIVSVRPSNKDVSLDLAPFSENVEKHCVGQFIFSSLYAKTLGLQRKFLLVHFRIS